MALICIVLNLNARKGHILTPWQSQSINIVDCYSLLLTIYKRTIFQVYQKKI